ncbi:MAG TPA: type II TA system antitoxin MqsA family protein [Desulfatiglandales bacterium]|nr:type II TA system antitoxin MqsA family protein [Desulfatiglandales bacterium]
MKCPACNKVMTCRTGEYHYTESGLNNVYLSGVEICECTCKEKMVAIPSVMELHRLIGIVLINKNTPLTGEEIKFLCKNMGISGKIFAEVIGIDKATLSRWENDNQVVLKSNDRLIRLAYSNVRGISKKEIKRLIEDKFREIKPEQKETSRFTIPVEQWAKQNMCAV